MVPRRCCLSAFSSCGELGLLLLWSTSSRRVGFSSCSLKGLVAPQHMEYSQASDRTSVPCIGRRFLPTVPPRKSLEISLIRAYSCELKKIEPNHLSYLIGHLLWLRIYLTFFFNFIFLTILCILACVISNEKPAVNLTVVPWFTVMVSLKILYCTWSLVSHPSI